MKGLTLLELLVALAIFALVAVMAYGGLNVILDVRSQTDEQAAQLRRLQMTFNRFGQDIEQQLNRAIRNEYGDSVPAMQGESTNIRLTRSGWQNPARQSRSTLQRVGYYLEDNALWRIYWPMLDRAQDAKPYRIKLLSGVSHFRLRYLDSTGQWQESWPVTLTQSVLLPGEAAPSSAYLKAVEIVLTVQGWGTLRRLFEVVASS